MIRAATEKDLPAIEAMGRGIHAESRYARYDFSADKYNKVARHCLENGISLVVEENGHIVGALFANVGQHYFGNDLQSTDLIHYILPQFRRGWTAVRLLKAYIVEAKALGVVDICIGNSSGLQPQRVWRLYERLGFKLIGGGFALQGD